ncbi:hypothetical protein [Flavobacterium poyangense]|uniref:hypothetical protein n=1 Tax=Flavobacterium poyangense TaxID=2204302 RepID=UPI0014213612|nr:hypothetical protein [Flavobacterium sp. JXAS1]
MSRQQFPIVIYPKATKLEQSLFVFLVLVVFVPFAYGVMAGEVIYCSSLVFGIFGIATYNYFTDFKFTISKIVQKRKFVVFTEDEILLEEEEKTVAYKWCELEQIEINIFAYKNKRRTSDSHYKGLENSIKFKKDTIEYEYLFYIEEEIQFNLVQDFFKKGVLPGLYALKNIKNETIFISELNYERLQEFKREKSINRYTDQIYFNV